MAATNAGQVTASASHAGVNPRARAWLRAAGPVGRTSAATLRAHRSGLPSWSCAWTTTCRALAVPTRAAIYHEDGREASRPWSRLGWEDVRGVGWDDRRYVLT